MVNFFCTSRCFILSIIILPSMVHCNLTINNDGSQIMDPKYQNNEQEFLEDFQSNPVKLDTSQVIPDYPGKVPNETIIAGTGPVDIQEVIMKWLSLYQEYRTPFTYVSTDPSVFLSLNESDYECLNVLRHISKIYNTSTYVNGHELSYIITAINHGKAGQPGQSAYDVFRLPILTSSLAIVYNIPDMPSGQTLQLSLQQMADIFSGKMLYWNDATAAASFSANNPWYTQSSLATSGTLVPITIGTLEGISGQTHWLTMALTDGLRTGGNLTGWTTQANYSSGNFIFGLGKVFPAANYFQYTTSVEVLGGTLSTPYRICVAYLSDAVENSAPIARLETWYKNGIYVAPTIQAMEDYWTYFSNLYGTVALGSSAQFSQPPNNSYAMYPLLSFYYVYIGGLSTYKTSIRPTCRTATNILRFLRFVLTDPSIPETIASRSWPYVMPKGIMYAVFLQMMREDDDPIYGTTATDPFLTCQDSPQQPIELVWNLVKAEILLEERMIVITKSLTTTQLIVILLSVLLLLLAIATWFMRRHFAITQRIRNFEFKIDSSDIFLLLRQNETLDRYKGVIASRRMVDYHVPRSYVHTLYFGRWNAYQVMLRPCSLNVHRMDKGMKQAIIEMIDFSQHWHVGTLYGICEIRNGRYFVSDFCPYGDLRSSIIAKDYQFTLNTKFSLAGDIADGMDFLHLQGILHGNLRSCAIYIEADLSAKVGDWEYAHLHRLQGSYFAQETRLARTLTLFEQTAFYPWLYWTAPEVLQSGMLGRPAIPTEAQDVYSFGIIMGEIFGDDAAFQRFQDAPYNFTPTEILTKILSGNLRPRLPPGNDAPSAVHHLLEHCWSSNPGVRPSFKTIKKVLFQVSSFRKPASDLLVIESQLMADKLKRKSKRMEEKYDTVSKEFHRYSHVVVPPPIWRQIYLTHLRPPLTRHDDVVVLRCTLTNLNGILTAHDPQVAIDTVNTMYRVFDEMIDKNGRVYRLFWDGATVTAVGGAPFGLDLDPVHSIAQIALDYLVWGHTSRAPSQSPLQLRFGLHSGPVSAGCLDYSAAHYVLFGELSKVAYLIESASQPSRILVSEEFNDRLKKLAKVYVKYRVIESTQPVRGYEKKTYWLIGSNYFDQQYLLDDILYGKDEIDVPVDDFVLYGMEYGMTTDRHMLRTEPVTGKTIRGSGLPEAIHSAVIVRSLRKKHAHIMRVPPQHVLDAQVRQHPLGKGHHKPHHGHDHEEHMRLGEHKRRHGSEDVAGPNEFPPTAADLTVGIFHRTNLDEEMLEEQEMPGPLLQSINLERVNFGHRIRLPDDHVVKSDQSILSSLQSDLRSANSGEGAMTRQARLNIVQTPVLGAILGLDETRRTVARLESTPPRPYVITLTKSVTSGQASTTNESKADLVDPPSTDRTPQESILMVNSQLMPSDLLPTLTVDEFVVSPRPLTYSSSTTHSSSVSDSHGASSSEHDKQSLLLDKSTVLTDVNVGGNVYADPPEMDGSISNLDLPPSLERHLQNLTRKSYATDLHSIEGDSEEFHNELRDRHVQDIRNAEAHHTDSDSFHLRLPAIGVHQTVTAQYVSAAGTHLNGVPSTASESSAHEHLVTRPHVIAVDIEKPDDYHA